MDEARPVQPLQVSPRTVFVAVMVIVLVGLGLLFLSRTLGAVALTIVSGLLAVALDRGVRFLQRHGWRRGFAVAVHLLLLLALLTGIGLLIVPPAIEQVQQLSSQLPQLVERLRNVELPSQVSQRLDEWSGKLNANQLAGAVLSTVSLVISALGAFVTVLFVTTFMLLFAPPLIRDALAQTLPDRRHRYREVLSKLYDSVGGYITGLSLVSATSAVATATFLAIIGVPWFIPLGVLSGLGSFVPFIGALIAGSLITLVAWGTGGTWVGLGTLAFYLVYQQVESNVIAPAVYRKTIALNPLLAILAFLFLAELAGVAGALLAIPAVVTIQIVLREVLRLRRERLSLPGEEGPVLRETQPPPPEEAKEDRPLH